MKGLTLGQEPETQTALPGPTGGSSDPSSSSLMGFSAADQKVCWVSIAGEQPQVGSTANSRIWP